MKFLYTKHDFDEYISKLVDLNPTKIYISTYGLYAGILHDGRNMSDIYDSPVYRLLSKINNNKTQILVGVPSYYSCNTIKCIPCESNYAKQLFRLLATVDEFSNINWKLSIDCHAKYYLFEYGNRSVGVFGGRNLTNSKWFDINVVAKTVDEAISIHKEQFDNSLCVDNDAVQKLLIDNNISHEAIELLSL